MIFSDISDIEKPDQNPHARSEYASAGNAHSYMFCHIICTKVFAAEWLRDPSYGKTNCSPNYKPFRKRDTLAHSNVDARVSHESAVQYPCQNCGSNKLFEMNRVFHVLMEFGKVLPSFANVAFVLLAFAMPIQHMQLNK